MAVGAAALGILVSLAVAAQFTPSSSTSAAADTSTQEPAEPAPLAVDSTDAYTPAPTEPTPLTLSDSPYADTFSGYEDAGNGVAWKWTDGGSCTPDLNTIGRHSGGCWQMQVGVYADCTNGVRATIDVPKYGHVQSSTRAFLSAGDIANLQFDDLGTTAEDASFVEASCRTQIGVATTGSVG
jgi:hypothetical protein